jgi:RHS repeat-associated protein
VVFLYDGWNMIAEIDTTTSARLIRSYEWGLDVSGTMDGAGGVGGLLVERFHTTTSTTVNNSQPPPTGSHAPCYEGNGNVMELINLANGGVSARYEYGAFGETISVDGDAIADANPIRFSTKYLDGETGLLYYTHRYYDAGKGRWPSRDPIEEAGGNNLYGMVGNDPVNWIDALGLMTYAEFAAAVDAAATPRDLYKIGGENNYLLTCHCGVVDIRHVALAIEGVTQGPTRPPGRQQLPPMTPEDYMNFAFDREMGNHPLGTSTPDQRANQMSNFDPNGNQGGSTEDHPSDAIGALAGAGGKWKDDLKKIVNSCSVVPKNITDAFIAKYVPPSRYVLAAPRNPFAAPQLIDDKLRSLGECCPERKPGETPQDYFNRSGLRYNPSPSQNVNGRNTPSGPGTINWPR